MKSILLLLTALILPLTSIAGTGTHGGDPMKDRFIIALEDAKLFLNDLACAKSFSASECKTMILKLRTVQKSECDGEKLCWYNTDPTKPQLALKPMLFGHGIEAILETTEDLYSSITVDIIRAKALQVSPVEALVGILHEAGHAIKLSDALITDELIIKMLTNDDKLRSKLHLVQTVPVPYVAANNPACGPKGCEYPDALSTYRRIFDSGSALDVNKLPGPTLFFLNAVDAAETIASESQKFGAYLLMFDLAGFEPKVSIDFREFNSASQAMTVFKDISTYSFDEWKSAFDRLKVEIFNENGESRSYMERDGKTYRDTFRFADIKNANGSINHYLIMKIEICTRQNSSWNEYGYSVYDLGRDIISPTLIK